MDAGGTATDRRRAKAVVFVLVCAALGMAPHWLPPARNTWPAIAAAVLLGGYSLRTVLLESLRPVSFSTPLAAGAPPPDAWPAVDVVVAARDEQAVITRLVEHLAGLRYPEESLRSRVSTWSWASASSTSIQRPCSCCSTRLRAPDLPPPASGGRRTTWSWGKRCCRPSSSSGVRSLLPSSTTQKRSDSSG